jgi:hypothetical protein
MRGESLSLGRTAVKRQEPAKDLACSSKVTKSRCIQKVTCAASNGAQT